MWIRKRKKKNLICNCQRFNNYYKAVFVNSLILNFKKICHAQNRINKNVVLYSFNSKDLTLSPPAVKTQ
jgi:hypothetical protein